MLSTSVSIENFLKIIYQLERNPERHPKTGVIAERLKISNAATTDMAKKLSEKGLIHYEKYKPLSLTKAGRDVAINLIRKHRLWETFLHKVFEFDLNQIHVEAEDLEHATSDNLANKISEFLGHPQYDPHGDPIPDVNGLIPENLDVSLLSNMKKGTYQVARISSSDNDFFAFCKAHNIFLQSELEVVQHFEKIASISIKINGNIIVLPRTFANNIYVKPLASLNEV